jgi:hypothetical protein
MRTRQLLLASAMTSAIAAGVGCPGRVYSNPKGARYDAGLQPPGDAGADAAPDAAVSPPPAESK